MFRYLELDRTSVAPYHANTRHLQVVEWESLMLKQYDPARVQKPGYSSHADGDIVRLRRQEPLSYFELTNQGSNHLHIPDTAQQGPNGTNYQMSWQLSRCLIGCPRRHAYMSSSSFTRTTAGAGRVVVRDISQGSVSRTERQEICP